MTYAPFPDSPQDTVRRAPIESLPAVPPSRSAHAADPTNPAPFGRDPLTGEPFGENSKITAGLLQVFFGAFGAGRFYMGSRWIGGAQVALTVTAWTSTTAGVEWATLGMLGSWAWSAADGVAILTRRTRDSRGRLMRS